MSLNQLLRLLRRSALLIAFAAALGIVVSSSLALLQAPKYVATLSMFVSGAGDRSADERLADNQFALSRVPSYAALGSTAAVLDPAARALGDDTSGSVRGEVSVSAVTGTNILAVSATATSAQRAADVANAVATSLSEAVSRLESARAANSSSFIALTGLETATPPLRPSNPGLLTVVLQGLLGGLAVGVMIVLLRSLFGERLIGAAGVSSATGYVPFVLSSNLGQVSSRLDSGEVSLLAAQLLEDCGKNSVIAVTPVRTALGAVRLAEGLSRALADDGSSVLLINCSALEVPNARPGELQVEAAMPEGLKRHFAELDSSYRIENEYQSLKVRKRLDSSDIDISASFVRRLLPSVAREYDWVVIVLDSVLEHPGLGLVAARARVTLLTATDGRPRRTDLLRCLDRLEIARVDNVRIILQDVRRGDLEPLGRTLRGPRQSADDGVHLD